MYLATSVGVCTQAPLKVVTADIILGCGKVLNPGAFTYDFL